MAVAATLAELLPVLDDVGRAREHGELDGAFKAVGEALESTLGRLGLEPFGEVGDRFDPMRHEALTHEHRDDVDQPVCVAVYQPGYTYGGRVVPHGAHLVVAGQTLGERAAHVPVADDGDFHAAYDALAARLEPKRRVETCEISGLAIAARIH